MQSTKKTWVCPLYFPLLFHHIHINNYIPVMFRKSNKYTNTFTFKCILPSLKVFQLLLGQWVFFPFPVLTTGGSHRHTDQMGLQPGPTHAALPSQILLQTAGWEREQQDPLPWPQLQVREGQRSVMFRYMIMICYDIYSRDHYRSFGYFDFWGF